MTVVQNYKIRFTFTTGDSNVVPNPNEYIKIFNDIVGPDAQIDQAGNATQELTHNPYNTTLMDHNSVVSFTISGIEAWSGENSVEAGLETLQGFITSNDMWTFYVEKYDLEYMSAVHMWKSNETEPFYLNKGVSRSIEWTDTISTFMPTLCTSA